VPLPDSYTAANGSSFDTRRRDERFTPDIVQFLFQRSAAWRVDHVLASAHA
jgi:hypothetical protein